MDTRIGMGEAGGSGATSAPDNAPSSATGRQRPVLTSRIDLPPALVRNGCRVRR